MVRGQDGVLFDSKRLLDGMMERQSSSRSARARIADRDEPAGEEQDEYHSQGSEVGQKGGRR
jgi:hypothetical protein